MSSLDIHLISIQSSSSSNLVKDSRSNLIRSGIVTVVFVVVPFEQSQRVYRKRNPTQDLRAAHGRPTARSIVAVEHKAAINQCSTFVDALLPCRVPVSNEEIVHGAEGI